MKIDSKKYPLPSRFRHHTSPNLYLPLSELKAKPDYYPPLIDKIDWKELFLNGNPPDSIDIGCGKGQFLLDYTEQNPKKNILGIEIRKGPVDWLKEIIRGENIPNAAVIWYSVVNGLNFIETNSIGEAFYLFPDPWFKKKHIKRRAFSEVLLENIHKVLKSDGVFYIATDVENVNEYHLEVLNITKYFRYEIIEDDGDWNLPRTNKELFCLQKDIKYYRIKAYKNL